MFQTKSKDKPEVIKLSIDAWFPDQISLQRGIVDFLTKEGEDCRGIDPENILLNGKRYRVSKRTVLMGYPYQEQRLNEVKKAE